MTLTRCTGCMELIPEGEVRYAFDEAYCERCFDDLFTYCCRCDRLLERQNVQWDRDGDPHCAECFEEENDDESPDNPEIYDGDRKMIIELCRGFLYDKPVMKTLIRINREDYFLPKLSEKVGLVNNSVYVYGLADKEGREILVSSNLIDSVKSFLQKNNLNWIIAQDSGVNRIGIGYTLRKNNLDLIACLIRKAATVSELQPA